MSNSNYDSILDINPMDTPEAQLEFQNFVLNSAEQNLISGNVSTTAAPPSSSAPLFATPTNTVPTSGIGAVPLMSQPGGATKTPATSAFWTLEFYAQWFDVDTSDVVGRIMAAVIPRGGFLDKISGNPDLYGPFWISTTVIFALFVTSSIAASIYAYLDSKPYIYDMTLLSFAVSTVYIYVTLLPGIVWGLCRYFGAPMSFFELVDLYGYGLSIWIPVSLLCIIPSELSRWILIGIAFGVSTFFMVQNIQPHLTRSSNKAALTVILSVLVTAHAGLALLFRFGFFRFVYDVSTPPGGNNGLPSKSEPAGGPTPTA
ncbi:hypothetical protein HDV05_003030 [Chytridiales sp. JEL 0842]|nr:hypothetical protein HDV05_003030 [Chytridiales sp. JEL 0842]